jgi:hypothetical protein
VKCKVLHNALAIKETRPTWWAWIVPRGAVIDVLDEPEVSPVTRYPSELTALVQSQTGQTWKVHLATNTPLSKPLPASTAVRSDYPNSKATSLTTWDDLRVRLAAQGWTFQEWLIKYGAVQPDVIRQIVRELGGTPKPDPVALSAQALRLVTKEDTDMTTAAKTTAKESTARKNGAATKNAAPRARSAQRSAGTSLVELLPHNSAGYAIAKSMSDGKDATHAQLKTLRDAINEAAGKARDDKKASLATKLSDANRLVRRLERDTRKA